MSTVSISKGFSGLNTRVDETSLPKSEHVPLASCLNVDIDDAYRLSVRHGFSMLEQSGIGDVHSCFSTPNLNFIVFCDGDALSLYNISTQETTRIRNISINKSMEYEINNGLIYYTNGIEQGVIEIATLTNRPWEIETDYFGPKNTRDFSNPPIGNLIHYYKGRMYVVVGKIVFISQAFDTSRFLLDEGNILLDDAVTMITSTDNCLIIGTTKEVICFLGSNPGDFAKKTLTPSVAINGTQQQIYPTNLGIDTVDLGVIFLTTKGLIFISGNGELIKLSEDQIDIPKISNYQGSSVINKGKYICQFNTTN